MFREINTNTVLYDICYLLSCFIFGEKTISFIFYYISNIAIYSTAQWHCKSIKDITVVHGVEVGNIFKLGNKYTSALNMTYQDKAGQRQTPIMGCYGIGIGRLAACICESHHDEHGPIWPMSVAPWLVEICAINSSKNTRVTDVSDKIYKLLIYYIFNRL